MRTGGHLLCGLGAGAVDYGLNYLFSIGFGKRSPAMLGILNAHYGLGAAAGPLRTYDGPAPARFLRQTSAGVAAGPLSGLGIERFGDTSVPWLLAAVSAACILLALKLTLLRALTNNSIVDELVAGR